MYSCWVDQLVRDGQAEGRLPGDLTRSEHFKLEALHYVKEEAGLQHSPPENELNS